MPGVLRVLVIEDDEDARDLVVTLVGQTGHKADAVANGEDALQMLKQKAYDVCVVDIALPGMDGWDLLKEVKRNPATSHIPCIAVTAFHDSAVEERAMREGFDAYFPKPLDPMMFIRQLEFHAG